ncbi:SigE family RNA polymerase sigma factor [Micromonospora auratinigra]|uniref:RNA polymerase sigma factor n=1 Tax=Micromonospora auratinigra TaxID=261654 RepID=A0A1A8ZTA8_9ACTN|nr:SigE family RNA polymerase sigma factor [Micromonospora auratinigra]SBT47112.1 RNA polymerase sigma-70 factor, sigma-E family [Micromonospora auratinigra]
MQPTFEEFVTARGGTLLRFALMLTGDRHQAEDLVQSVLAKAYVRWARVAAMAQPEAYLKQVLVNENLRWWRRRSSRETPVAEPADGPAGSDGPGAYAAREAAWALLGRLPRRQRAVLVLRYYEDLADTQIAEILGCTPGTVRSQAARALATLRAVVPTMDREALP